MSAAPQAQLADSTVAAEQRLAECKQAAAKARIAARQANASEIAALRSESVDQLRASNSVVEVTIGALVWPPFHATDSAVLRIREGPNRLRAGSTQTSTAKRLSLANEACAGHGVVNAVSECYVVSPSWHSASC